jgi:hypothetical protein
MNSSKQILPSEFASAEAKMASMIPSKFALVWAPRGADRPSRVRMVRSSAVSILPLLRSAGKGG